MKAFIAGLSCSMNIPEHARSPPYRHHLCLNRTSLISEFPLSQSQSHTHTPMVTVRSAIRIRTSLINFVTIKDFLEIRSNRYMGREMHACRQTEREKKVWRHREGFCVGVKKCLLPAVECVVLLFQGKFSLLDLNHLPGQILWFPTDTHTQNS